MRYLLGFTFWIFSTQKPKPDTLDSCAAPTALVWFFRLPTLPPSRTLGSRVG
jgi:hypothetical protein